MEGEMSMQNHQVDEEDLYDDLDDIKAAPASTLPAVAANRTASSSDRTARPPGRASDANEQELVSLREKVKALERENQVLKRNIGTLFRTARNEIKRKDNQIHSLMTQSPSPSPPSHPHPRPR
jgi:hypothetical protein